jgi:ribosome-associated protein
MTLSPERLAIAIAAQAADKKARDIVALDLRGVAGYTDFFVVCSGNTDRQTKAIHDGIHLALKKEQGLLPRRVEGLSEARWILMDYLDVVAHVFTPDTRDFYRLESLWGDVPRLDLHLEGLAVAPGAGAGRAAG